MTATLRAARPARPAEQDSSTRIPLRDLPLLPALLFLTVFFFPIEFQIGSIALSAYRIICLIACIPLIWLLFTGRAGPLRGMDMGVFGFVIWSLIALGYWHGFEVIELGGAISAELLAGYLMGRVCVQDARRFLAFSRFYFLLVLATLPFALAESQTGDAVIIDFINSLPGVEAGNNHDPDPRLGLERVQVGIQHPIHYGLVTGLAFCMVVVGFTLRWSRTQRFLAGLVIFTCSFLSLSSGAFLAFLLQLGLLIWATAMRRVPGYWWVLTALGLMAYAVLEVMSTRSAITAVLSYVTFSAHTAWWRTLIFSYGMENVWSSPIVGIGLNDWERPRWMFTASVDNYWLLTTMRFGLPAFFMLAIPWVVTMVRLGMRKIPADSELFYLRRGWMFMIMGLTFALATVHVWSGPYTMTFALLGMGLWMQNAPIGNGEQADGAPVAEDNARYSRSQRQLQATDWTVDPNERVEPGAVYSRFGRGDGATRHVRDDKTRAETSQRPSGNRYRRQLDSQDE